MDAMAESQTTILPLEAENEGQHATTPNTVRPTCWVGGLLGLVTSLVWIQSLALQRATSPRVVAGPATEPFHWDLEAKITPQDRLADGLLGLAVILQQGPYRP